MNKQEKIIVVLLFGALLAWFAFIKPAVAPSPPAPASASSEAEPDKTPDAGNGPVETNAVQPVPVRVPAVLEAAPAGPPEEEERPRAPEQRVVLSNDRMSVTMSSWGAGVASLELKEYRAEVGKDSGPVRFDFEPASAFSFSGIPGLGTNDVFEVVAGDGGRSARFAREFGSLRLERTVNLAEGYRLTVVDSFTNMGSQEAVLPEYELALGAMRDRRKIVGRSSQPSNMGVDTLAASGGEDVVHWAARGPADDSAPLAGRFQPPARQGGGCGWFKPKLQAPLPVDISMARTQHVAWVAVKSHFFAQLMAPAKGGAGFSIRAARRVPSSELPEDRRTWTQTAQLEEVSARLRFGEKPIGPGESHTREIAYYMGPAKYSLLKDLGRRQDRIMFRVWRHWEWFRPLCTGLLSVLNRIHSVTPNYGVAIILMTLLVRIVFWPITYKTNQGMKKLQALKPLLDGLKEKHKNDPRRFQQEQWALYREHKISPLTAVGCLPMLIQMPVFIAFFNVLRSAVELRFAEFLWISDLSAPEGLLSDVLPIPLNILPILMTIVSYVQQKLTPSSADQQQKQMMYFMPLFMLFILYNMASALVLYWTSSQVFAIVELLIQRRMAARREAAKSGARPA